MMKSTQPTHRPTGSTTPRSPSPRVSIETPYGCIVIEVYPDRAPITAGNFLRYVDEERYQGATFYRSIRPDNGRRVPHFSAIQGGIDPTCLHPTLPPISHESTKSTGLSHVDGAVSMARWAPGTAGSEFFIAVGDCRALDFGMAYEEGYAVFGQVVQGMEIVHRISASATGASTAIEYIQDQALIEPVTMQVRRVATT